jgi:PAS domain S-box-containing protein
MNKQLRILILEDNNADAELMMHELRKGNITFESRRVETKEAFEKSLEDFAPDLILADYTLPAFDGQSALRISNEKLPDVPFIFVSGTIGEDFAIESLKSGATDYVLKDRMSRLASAVNRALREAKEKVEYKKAEKALKDSEEKLRFFRNLIDQSNDAFFVNDPETGRILDANDKACINLGYKREELLNMRVFDFEATIPDNFSWNEHVKEIQERRNITLEGQHRRKDGTIFPVEVNINYVVIGNVNYMIAVARDITERKRAEKEKDRLLKAIDSGTEGIAITDEKDRYIYVNRAHAMIYGYSQEELIGKTWRDVTPSEIIAPIEKEWSGIMHNKEVGEFSKEGPGLRKDGTIIPVEVKATSLWDEKGSYQGHICIVRDITERKRAEEELRIKAQLLDDATDSIFVHDLDGNFIYLNKGAYISRGFSKEEMMGMKLHGIVTPEYARLIKPRIEKLLKDGECTFESVHLRKDKSTMPVETHPRIIESGGRELVLSVVRDITERKQMEDTLRRKEEHFRSLIENALDTITILDKDGTIIYESPSTERVLGYKPEELTGKNSFEFIHPEDLPGIMSAFKLGIQNPGSTQSAEYRFKHKDGSWRVIESMGKLILDNAGSTYVIVNSRDITERKRAEEALQYRLEFEKLITSISTNFINIASDEIDGEINNALKKIGEFAGVDRSYVILVSEDGTKIDNVYEWCADEKYPMVRRLKGVLFDSFPWFVEKMRRHETIYVPRISDLPPEASVEIAELQKVSVKSIIEVPIISGGVLFGYLGFTSVQREVTWSEDLIALLKIVGEIFVNALVRKMAEAAVWESESRFRAIFEKAAIGMTLTNLEGRPIVSNPALQEMLGYSGEEIHNMVFTEFTHPDDIAFNMNFFKELAAGERDFYQIEKRYIRKDGGVIWGRLTVSLIRGDNGEPQFSIGMVEDITERKRAEELLKERARAELYGFIVSALPVFASNIPSQVRNILVRNFAMRFERNIRSKFKEEMKQLSLNTDSGIHDDFDDFLLWLAGLFSNLGIKTKTASGEVKRSFELLNCPWKGEASGNPIFCLICRTIVMRSFTWTPLRGMAEQKSSIANGSSTCNFEINVNQQRYQGDH